MSSDRSKAKRAEHKPSNGGSVTIEPTNTPKKVKQNAN